ncbi:hypothetical protein OAB94_02155 [Flavobacteriaceae bacterium]|nr:hypothetical protein [Flavobacteriaceae bacterium]
MRRNGFGLKTDLVEQAPVVQDGPGFAKYDAENYQGDKDRLTKFKDEQMQFGVQSALWGPYNRSDSPSAATTITALVLNFVLCLVYGLVFTILLHEILKAGPDEFLQSFILACLSAGMYYVGMSVTYEPLLRTEMMLMSVFGEWGTFTTVGVTTFLMYVIAIFGGYASGGAIANALVGPLNTGVIPNTMNAGKWMYWFGGSMIVFVYLFVTKFHRFKAQEDRSERAARAVTVTAAMIFAMTIAFRPLGLFYFDAGLYIAGMAGTGSATDAAFFICVPLASAATGAILFWLVKLGIYFSNEYDTDVVDVGAKYRSMH